MFPKNGFKKYLGKCLTKKVKDMHTENYKMLRKEFKDLEKWKDMFTDCMTQDGNIPQTDQQGKYNLIIPAAFSQIRRADIKKFTCKVTLNTQDNLDKNTTDWKLLTYCTGFTTYQKATILKTM